MGLRGLWWGRVPDKWPNRALRAWAGAVIRLTEDQRRKPDRGDPVCHVVRACVGRARPVTWARRPRGQKRNKLMLARWARRETPAGGWRGVSSLGGPGDPGLRLVRIRFARVGDGRVTGWRAGERARGPGRRPDNATLGSRPEPRVTLAPLVGVIVTFARAAAPSVTFPEAESREPRAESREPRPGAGSAASGKRAPGRA